MSRINVILNQIVTDVSGFTEVVSLDDIKDACRISSANSAEDAYLNQIRVSARQAAEFFTGQAFVKKTVTVLLRNECGGIFLPHQPIDVSTVVITVNGVADTTSDKYGLTTIDGQAQLLTATCDILTVTYSCGYTTAGINAAFATVPMGVNDGIKAEAAYRWANRATQVFTPGSLCIEARNYLTPYCTRSLF